MRNSECVGGMGGVGATVAGREVDDSSLSERTAAPPKALPFRPHRRRFISIACQYVLSQEFSDDVGLSNVPDK
jgi:hypothetical protein